jgi:hypothetical protein
MKLRKSYSLDSRKVGGLFDETEGQETMGKSRKFDHVEIFGIEND